MVHQQRLLRRGERSARPTAAGLGSGARGRSIASQALRSCGRPTRARRSSPGPSCASRSRASLVLVLALAASAALPWYAYLRAIPSASATACRWSSPALRSPATGIGLLPRRIRAVAAAAAVAAVALAGPTARSSAPLIAESQRDAQNLVGRRAVTAYLVAHHDGRPIMMSMGSLAHYMHDLSSEGFRHPRLSARRQW